MTEPEGTESPQRSPEPEPALEPDDRAAAEAAAAALRRATKSTAPARKRTVRHRTASFSDDRDPTLLGNAVDRLVRDSGWEDRAAVAALMSQWPEIVGADLAAHVQPTAFTDGELTVQAESTAWATQVRLLLPTLHRTIDQHLGTGIVRSIRIQGPQAPSWTSGPRRVKGRGPRDTYG